jgi:trehalose 6-phosphate phosphatase
VSVPAALTPFVDDPPGAVLLLDFDGTLAPIVADPSAARPLPRGTIVLDRLVHVLGRVAVISGRPVEFLATHLPIAGLELAGVYGLERRVDGATIVDPRAREWADAVDATAAEAKAELPGLRVERKGRVSVTIHWREDPAREDDARAVAAAVAERHGLAPPMPGRMAVELRPPVPVDKGTVAAELVEGFAVAAFAGDDVGDLTAFTALSELVARGRIWSATSIGVSSPEAPAGIRGADVVVDGPGGLVDVLAELADAISARG